MTSCMSSKRSNQLSYASKQWIVYHILLQYASLFSKKSFLFSAFRFLFKIFSFYSQIIPCVSPLFGV